MKLSIQSNAMEHIKAFTKVPSQLKAAQIRAINDTAARAKTKAVRIAQDVLELKSQKPIREAITIVRATSGRLDGAVIANGKAIPLAYFRKVSATKTGVNASFMGQSITVPHGFKSRRLGNHFFRRIRGSGPSGLHPRKIYELKGPSVPRAVLQDAANRAIRDTINTTYPKRLAYWVDRYTK